MPSKRAEKKTGKDAANERGDKARGGARPNGNGDGRARVAGPELESGFDENTRPSRLNPESPEEREKRLAARKALTLRAFRMTYENRRRKASR